MDELRGHLITTGADGALLTPIDAVDELIEAMCAAPRVVLHFHGGLVSEEAGLRAAAGLLDTYRGANAYPVFFIWRSGLVEIVRGNLGEIADERAFRVVSKWVLKFAVGKLRAAVGAKGAALTTPSDRDVYEEMDKVRNGGEPYAGLDSPRELDELTAEQEAEVEQRMRADPELQAIGIEISESALPEEVRQAAKGVTVTRRLSDKTLMSPEVVRELQQDAVVAEGEKGLVTSAALARKGAKVLARVISRFRARTDHGLYPTVIEEVLAEFYLANAGAAIWQMMKKETLDTFEPGDESPRGGSYFLERLGSCLSAGRNPSITLVGHSTGAVFINHLLATVSRMREDPDGALPAEFRFRNIAFLAPACTFGDFAPVLGRHEELWDDLRLFAMTDEAEREDALVPLLYPRSLLYFVSGVCETDADGNREPGKPLLGLRRYYTRSHEHVPDEVRAVLEYMTAQRAVWSPVDGGPGLSASAVHHGDFDNDPKVRESLRAMIGRP